MAQQHHAHEQAMAATEHRLWKCSPLRASRAHLCTPTRLGLPYTHLLGLHALLPLDCAPPVDPMLLRGDPCTAG